MDRVLHRSLYYTHLTRWRSAPRPALPATTAHQAGSCHTGHGFGRGLFTATSVNCSLSPGEVLAVNLHRTVIGLGLVLGAAVVYYGISNLNSAVLHLDAARLVDEDRLGSPDVSLDTNSATPTFVYASHKELQLAIQKLRATLDGPGATTLDPKVLKAYGSSENSYHVESPHSVVVRPENTEDVVAIVSIARKFKVPIVPYSGATSLEGHISGVGFPSPVLNEVDV